MAEDFNGHDRGRLDRIEAGLEALTNHVARTDRQIEALLTHGQTVNETLSRVAESQVRLAEAQLRLAEAQNHTEERLNALISVVDDLIRRNPRP